MFKRNTLFSLAMMSLAGLLAISQFAMAGQPIRVGISLPTQREEIWVHHKNNMEAAAKKLGVDVLVQISDNDAAKQQAQCENLLTQGLDVLVVGAHDAQAAANIVEMAHEMKVPVVSYDRLILDADVDVYVSFDNEKVGELQGKWFVDHVKSGNIIILSGDPLDNNAKLFRQGAVNILKPHIDSGRYTLLMDQPVQDWQPNNAMRLVENCLTSNDNNVQGILAPNDGTAGGAIQALAAQGLAGKVPVTGQDFELTALQRIAEGTQGMTVFKNTVDEGAATIEAAVKLAKSEKPAINNAVNNGKIDVPSVLLVPLAVDSGNLDDMVKLSGLYSVDLVHGK